MKLKPQALQLVEILNQTDVSYEIIPALTYEAEALTEWLEINFPITRWGRIDWQNVKGECAFTDNEERITQLIQELSYKQKLDGYVVVFWSNVRKPSLKLPFKEALKYLGDLIAEDMDTWICNQDENWCIEVYHEGEVCFGYGNPKVSEKSLKEIV
jgi:hypothetical protein